MDRDNHDFDKYDKEIFNVDEVEGTDIKINPDYYIHTALIKAQNSLLDDNLSEGFTKFRVFIEHIETLCRAASMLSPEYENDLKKYQEENKDKLNKETQEVRGVLIANKKLELLMKEVFSKKVATNPLKA